MKKKILTILGLCIFILITISIINTFFDITLFGTTYEVTFNTNGGSDIYSQTVSSGKKIQKPEDPKKEGFIFVEWQLNGTKYNFDTEINDNIILNAVWEYDTKGYNIETKEGLKDLLVKVINDQKFDNRTKDYINGIFDTLYLNYPTWQKVYKDLPDINNYILDNLIMVIPNIKTINLYLNGSNEAKEVEEIGLGYTSRDENDEIYISLIYDNNNEESYLFNLEALFHEIIHCKQLINEQKYTNDDIQKMLLEGGATFNARFITKYDGLLYTKYTTCNKSRTKCFEHGKETGIGADYIRYMYSYDMLEYIVGYDIINKLEKGMIDSNYLSNLLKQKTGTDLLSLMAEWGNTTTDSDKEYDTLIKIEDIFLKEIKKDIESLNSFEDVKKNIDIYRHIKIKTLPKMSENEFIYHAKDDIFENYFDIKELDELLTDKIINYKVFKQFSNNKDLNKMAIISILKADLYDYFSYDGIYESLPLSYHLDETLYYYYEKNNEGHLILNYNNPLYSKNGNDSFKVIYLEFVFDKEKIKSIKEFNPDKVNSINKFYNLYLEK